MPTITWLAVSLASCALYAGRKPPPAIFITRAWASVVEARAVSAGFPCACLIPSSFGSWARA
jgi:hypothetical protein